MTLSKLIENEIADFFAGFGAPCEPDIQSGEAQRQLTERLLSVLALRERAEPVVWGLFHFSGGGFYNACSTEDEAERYMRQVHQYSDSTTLMIKPLYTAPPAPVVSGEYGDAYQGAREDLAIWKRRALESESEVRRLVEINDHLVKEAQGEARMGEPVIREHAPVVPDELLTAMEEVLRISDRQHDAWDKAKAAVSACRAAMPQGAENAESRCGIQPAPALDSLPKNAHSRCGNFQVVPDCSCRTCRPVSMRNMRFVVCPDCGNKRCPRANDHRNACSGSNEPGQEGSAYRRK